MDDDATRQAYARLTVHEFMLEILYAQYWAQGSPADAEEARRNILRLMRQAYAAPDVDPAALEDVFPLLRDAELLAERFLEKVILRAGQIREAQAQAREPR